MYEVMVLHAELGGQASAAGERSLLQRLPYAYRLELERRDAPARSASLAALRLLAQGVQRLQGVPLDVSRLHVPEGGKAFLDDGPRFSISHSAQRAAVAISEHGDLGLDIEDLDTLGMDRTRLERWTAIEATLKLVGAGLPRAREVQLSPDLGIAKLGDVVVHTRSLQLAPGCVARLATREPVRNVVVERVEDRG
jgi:phosphopantetheinyl transferase